MQRERMSYREAALQFNIPQGNKMIAKWERIYLEEGTEVLRVELRGRKSKGRSPKLEKKVEEDLLCYNKVVTGVANEIS